MPGEFPSFAGATPDVPVVAPVEGGSMLREFKEFAMRGNVIDMAVGIIIGAAFGAVVTSLVNDVMMPPIGAVIGNVDFTNLFFVVKSGGGAGPYDTLEAAKTAGAVTINYGLFINRLVNFLIVAFAVFLLVKQVNRLKSKQEAPAAKPTTRDCPYCFSTIPKKASRCSNCTSDVAPEPA